MAAMVATAEAATTAALIQTETLPRMKAAQSALGNEEEVTVEILAWGVVVLVGALASFGLVVAVRGPALRR